MNEHRLSYLDDTERLHAYETITKGCMHLWSKNKLQPDRLRPVLDTFALLAERDPLFLAHLTSYAIKKLESKDLKVVLTFINSLSDADGTPFSKGSEFHKPNWRIVSQAALAELDPKLVLRVLELAHTKMQFGNRQTGTHVSRHLVKAVRKYLRFREANPKALEGIRRSGMKRIVQNLYRKSRIAPSPDACRILRWKQKPGYPGADVKLDKSVFDFSGLSEVQIAQKIQRERLSPMGALGALPEKISPVIAAAVLEQASGDQAIVLTEMFEQQGLLKNKEVRQVYQEKIRTAKTALDRVDRIKSQMDQETRDMLAATRADKRKEDVGDFGPTFFHLDKSGSMHDVIRIAIDRGAVLAECIKNPETNFHWGYFDTGGRVLERPKKFVKDGFAAALYGVHPGGGTNCLALYETARRLGCLTDVYVTDEGHTCAPLVTMINDFRKRGVPDPRLVVIIKIGHGESHLRNAFEQCGIPVATLAPEQLGESALVAQAVRASMQGVPAVVEEILSTGLLALPKWWDAVKA